MNDDQVSNMDPQVARQLFEAGSILILFNTRMGMEIGIDCKSWNIGPKFKGIKMIPPGLHFLYWSNVHLETGQQGTRSGIFIHSRPREVLVYEFDWETETFIAGSRDFDASTVNLHEMDRFLGPYPLKEYGTWKHISNLVTEDVIDRILADRKKPRFIESMMGSRHSMDSNGTLDKNENYNGDENDNDNENEKRDPQNDNVNPVITFSDFDLRRPFVGSSLIIKPQDITAYAMDKSETLERLFPAGCSFKLLGEFQLSFIFLLLAFNYDGFEQWKSLMTLICRSPKFLMEKDPDFFCKFIECLYYQMIMSDCHVLRDFIGSCSAPSQSSFVTENFEILHEYYLDVRDGATSQNNPCISEALRKRLIKRFSALFEFLERSFNRTFERTILDDEQPTIVYEASQ